jgi:hypothetical protein
MQLSWISVLAFTMYHRYNVLDHLDSNNIWTTILMSINPTKIFMWALTAFQVDQYPTHLFPSDLFLPLWTS